jgi:hypothetical protein
VCVWAGVGPNVSLACERGEFPKPNLI